VAEEECKEIWRCSVYGSSFCGLCIMAWIFLHAAHNSLWSFLIGCTMSYVSVHN